MKDEEARHVRDSRRNSILVSNPDHTDWLGFCYECTEVHHSYECSHKYVEEKRPCPRHVAIPGFESPTNFTAHVVQKDGRCNNCTKKEEWEERRAEILRVRKMSRYAFDADISKEQKLFVSIRPDSRMEEITKGEVAIRIHDKSRARLMSRSETLDEIEHLDKIIDHFSPVPIPHQKAHPGFPIYKPGKEAIEFFRVQEELRAQKELTSKGISFGN